MLLEMHGEGPRGDRGPVKMLDPVKPFQTEINEHELTLGVANAFTDVAWRCSIASRPVMKWIVS